MALITSAPSRCRARCRVPNAPRLRRVLRKAPTHQPPITQPCAREPPTSCGAPIANARARGPLRPPRPSSSSPSSSRSAPCLLLPRLPLLPLSVADRCVGRLPLAADRCGHRRRLQCGVEFAVGGSYAHYCDLSCGLCPPVDSYCIDITSNCADLISVNGSDAPRAMLAAAAATDC